MVWISQHRQRTEAQWLSQGHAWKIEASQGIEHPFFEVLCPVDLQFPNFFDKETTVSP